MKEYLKIGIVLIFMVFLLTGCTNTEYEVKINNDGSGKVGYEVQFDVDMVNSKVNENNAEGEENKDGIAIAQEFEFFEGMMQYAESNGYNVEEIKNDNDYTVGYKATKDFENIINDFKFQDSVGEDYVIIAEDSGIKKERNFFTTKYTQNLTIDVSKGGDVINKIKVTYKFPFGTLKSNADKKSFMGSTLTWNMGKDEVRNIEYTVYSFNWPIYVIAVLVIVVVVLVAYILIKKNKKAKQENAELSGKKVTKKHKN